MDSSLEDFARLHFEVEEDYQLSKGCGCLLAAPALLFVIGGLGSVFADGLSTEAGREGVEVLLTGVGAIGLAGLLVWGGKSRWRRRVSHRMKGFLEGDPDTVEAVLRSAGIQFRSQIEAHRARTVGRDSEWVAARSSLRDAADEANRSVAYWRIRARQESTNPLAADRLRTATDLEAKLRSALNKLDARADLLREFYNDCEARIAAMDRHRQDIQENRRLEALSASADVVIADATAVLATIGAGVLHEARTVARVLTEFESLQIKSLAGEAPLDDLEYFADRIIERSDSELAAVKQLSKVLK